MRQLLITLLCLPFFCYGSYHVEAMTLEEKVGQLLMCHFNGTIANDDAKTLIQQLHVGGIIYYTWANELSSPKQVFELSTSLQELNHHQIPLLIAIDQEGGVLSRLSEGFTIFPGNGALGVINDPNLAEEAAYATGTELYAVGVNMNLAPVADVNNNPQNPVIGIRSFGDCPTTVTSLARAAIRGYHAANIITSLKHFPGHGDVSVDSHETLPVIQKPLEVLERIELVPFAALSSETDTMMTAHLMIPSIDPKHCATTSKNILDILRLSLKFNGVIISDSLMMEGLLNQYPSIEEISLRAFNAGCDILLLGGKQLVGTKTGYELTLSNIQKVHHYLLQAVKNGTIPESRLNESVQRILDLKAKYPLLPPNQLPLNEIYSKEHELLAKKIASLAVRVVSKSSFTSLQSQKISLFAPEILRRNIAKTSLAPFMTPTSSLFFTTYNPTQQETADTLSRAKNSDLSIVCSCNAWANPAQAALIHALIAQGKPVIVLILKDAIDATLFPKAACVITSLSPTAPSIEATYECLVHQ